MRHKIRLIIKMLLLVTAINVVVTLLLGSLFYYIWPENYFNWFPAIAIFFWIIGIGLTVSLELTHTGKPDAVTMTYMVARGVKLLLTIVFIAIYALVIKTNIKPFGLTTLAYYMTFLVIETYLFYIYEKRRKKRKSKIDSESQQETEQDDKLKTEKEIEIDA